MVKIVREELTLRHPQLDVPCFARRTTSVEGSFRAFLDLSSQQGSARFCSRYFKGPPAWPGQTSCAISNFEASGSCWARTAATALRPEVSARQWRLTEQLAQSNLFRSTAHSLLRRATCSEPSAPTHAVRQKSGFIVWGGIVYQKLGRKLGVTGWVPWVGLLRREVA